MTSKNIKFSNYELVAMVGLCLFAQILTIFPTNLIKNAGSASVSVYLIFTAIMYFTYKFILNVILNKEFDFFSLLSNTYSKTTCKILGCLFFIYFFTVATTFILNISLQLKAMTYLLSPLYAIGIYLLLGVFLGIIKGFNPLFKIVGYILPLIIIYIIFIFIMGLYFFDYHDFLPILGRGFNDSILKNLPNITTFSPIFTLLLFTKNDRSKKAKKRNKKILNAIFILSAVSISLVLITFLNIMPINLIATRLLLLFDVNRMISLFPSAQKLEPILILIYSLITFACAGFYILCACLSFEKTNILPKYSQYIIPAIIIIGVFTFIPLKMNIMNKISEVMSYVSIIACIIFPLFTVFKYKLKEAKNAL